MANRIRRNSMEHLQIYDLDKLISDRQLPPPLPPPRKHRQRLPPEFAFQRYQFLCDRNRHQTDPIYASTPMFTTIPQSNYIKHHRQLLGSRIPLNVIKPRPKPTSPQSAEPESAQTDFDNDNNNEEDNSDEDDSSDSDDDDDDSDDGGAADQSDSSSSSEDRDEDYFDDDDDEKGIVEQIFNRHKR